MPVKAWISALRLRTLPLALSSILMGSMLAAAHGYFSWPVFGWAVLTTILLQILSNLANDYGDTRHGADSNQRVGPQRAVQSGAITPRAMQRAIALFAILSLLAGLLLISTAFGWGSRYFYLFLGLGLVSIAAAYTYTAGARPYGYAGLGDLAVLLFFGLLGVGGSYFLFSRHFDWPVLAPAVAVGALATGVLNINNMRDALSDRQAGKRTIPVRWGHRAAVLYHVVLLLTAIVAAGSYLWYSGVGAAILWWLPAVVLLIINGVRVARTSPEQLDPYLRQLAMATLVFVLLFGVALLV